MTPEQKALIEQHAAKVQFNAKLRRAWYEIARERGYRFDSFLGTASHGTIAVISHLRAHGV